MRSTVTTSPTASLTLTRPDGMAGSRSTVHLPPTAALISSRASRAASARSMNTNASVPQNAIWSATLMAPLMPAPMPSV